MCPISVGYTPASRLHTPITGHACPGQQSTFSVTRPSTQAVRMQSTWRWCGPPVSHISTVGLPTQPLGHAIHQLARNPASGPNIPPMSDRHPSSQVPDLQPTHRTSRLTLWLWTGCLAYFWGVRPCTPPVGQTPHPWPTWSTHRAHAPQRTGLLTVIIIGIRRKRQSGWSGFDWTIFHFNDIHHYYLYYINMDSLCVHVYFFPLQNVENEMWYHHQKLKRIISGNASLIINITGPLLECFLRHWLYINYKIHSASNFWFPAHDKPHRLTY